MIIVRKTKVMPMTVEICRGKRFRRMKHPVSNQDLTENDTITLKELEEKNIMIYETRPHENYSPKKKAMFRPQKFYYEEE